MVKVVWTESALSDLNDIGEFIGRDSVRYAELTVARLFESTNILETHPKAGKKVPELNNNSFRESGKEVTKALGEEVIFNLIWGMMRIIMLEIAIIASRGGSLDAFYPIV